MFIPDNALHKYAYEDKPFPIGSGQTISQPYTVAFQTELLDLKPREKVLEIGTGSGFQTAVLLEMGVPNGDNFPYHHTPRDIIEAAEKQNEKQFLITHSFASGKEEENGFDMPALPQNTIQVEDRELYNLELSGITILQSPSERRY